MFELCLSLFTVSYGAQPSVEVEEIVSRYVSPNNGAGPLWCYGAPLLVRQGDSVFVNAMETGEDVPPLCNTRWQIFQRDVNGWHRRQYAEDFREREPCPLVAFADGRLFLSVNPSTESTGTQYGTCHPHLLEFTSEALQKSGGAIHPDWAEGYRFTDHSYRGIAVDAERGELLILNIDSPTGMQYWSYRDASGEWVKRGRIQFPIRSCYPQVALRNRAAHVLAIGDIVEPNEEWRTYKHEQTERAWDYVFRRLFYAWTPDIAQSDFAEPIELENLDATSGYIRNLDLWLDAEGAAHLLYLKQPVQSDLMRDKFFPDQPLTASLEYCVLKAGEIIGRGTLVEGGEGLSNEVPGNARFHAAADGRLFVVYYTNGENKLLQVLPNRQDPVHIPLEAPFHTFFTATERGGSAPSETIDLFGVGADSSILRYARIQLPPHSD